MSWSQIKDTGWGMCKLLCRSVKNETRIPTIMRNEKKCHRVRNLLPFRGSSGGNEGFIMDVIFQGQNVIITLTAGPARSSGLHRQAREDLTYM